jgi:hypothetical protein
VFADNGNILCPIFASLLDLSQQVKESNKIKSPELNSFFFTSLVFTQEGDKKGGKTILADPSLDESFVHNCHMGVLVHENSLATEILVSGSEAQRTFSSKITPLEDRNYSVSLREMRSGLQMAVKFAERHFRGDELTS